MNNIHTHYDNLKIARDAPIEVIKAAYKSLARKHHPDKNQESIDAQRIMKIINASYEILSDPEKRRNHDEWIVQQEKIKFDTAVKEAIKTKQNITKPDSYPLQPTSVQKTKFSSDSGDGYLFIIITVIIGIIIYFILQL